jgi:hypothetical protein
VKTAHLREATASTVPTPLGAVARGLIAATAGTLAMDLTLFRRYKHDGGKDPFRRWEFSGGLHSWEEAPAPAQIGRRIVEGVFQRKLPDTRVPLVNNITHWAYGIFAGAGYGLVAGSLRQPRTGYGAVFGASVWGASYVVLPAAGLYKPITQYDRVTLAKDLSAHLVYGLTTATAFNGFLRAGAGRGAKRPS